MTINPYRRKTQYYETDQMGVIHHAHYIHWFEEARLDFLEQLGYGYQKAVEVGIDFALLDLSCEYKSMTRFGDTVSVSLSITELSAMRIAVSYKVTDATTGALRTVGVTRHCFYDNIRKRPVSLKKNMPELYALFEALYAYETGQTVQSAEALPPSKPDAVTFDELASMLEQLAEELPPEFYRELNGGVNLLPDVRLHPQSEALRDLYILGDYHHEPNGLGRYINIYYGSFMRVHGTLPPVELQAALRKILLHEFTHHMESLAGEKGLIIKDAQDLARYKRELR